jgi:hypothetical protein
MVERRTHSDCAVESRERERVGLFVVTRRIEAGRIVDGPFPHESFENLLNMSQ